MLDLDLLKNFLAVLDCRGFTAAAQGLNSTQSTVSAKLARLEDQAGHKLIDRNRRGAISLTQEGEIIESMAREVLRLQKQALHRLKDTRLSGNIRIGMSEDIASGREYPRLIAEFARRQPNVKITVKVLPGHKLVKSLETSNLDHILCKSVGETTIRARELWRDTLVWCGSLEALQVKGDEISLGAFSEPCHYRQRAVDVLTLQRKSWRVVYESPSLAGVLAAIDAGIGITVLPDSLVGEQRRKLQAGVLPSPGDMSFVLMSRPDIQVEDIANVTFREVLLDLLPPYFGSESIDRPAS
jgi:DNA-binding transcriptional LysR family regulator